MTPKPAGPPESMQWMRSVDRRIEDLQRTGATPGVVGVQRFAAGALRDGRIDSPVGITDGWRRVVDAQDPNVSVVTSTGALKITLSAYTELIRTGSAAGAAQGVMRFAFEPGDSLNPSIPRTVFNGEGLVHSFSFDAGQLIAGGISGSISRKINVPAGSYTVWTEYLYNHLTAGVSIRWSRCELLAEPI